MPRAGGVLVDWAVPVSQDILEGEGARVAEPPPRKTSSSSACHRGHARAQDHRSRPKPHAGLSFDATAGSQLSSIIDSSCCVLVRCSRGDRVALPRSG
jgi:hypothetical protein